MEVAVYLPGVVTGGTGRPLLVRGHGSPSLVSQSQEQPAHHGKPPATLQLHGRGTVVLHPAYNLIRVPHQE